MPQFSSFGTEQSRASLVAVAIVPMILPLFGCGPTPQVVTYEVPKEEAVFEANHVEGAVRTPVMGDGMRPAPTPLGPTRMLAALVALEVGPLWSFKLIGPPDAVNPLVEPFREFLASLDFPEPDKPAWKLPDGWREEPGTGMRFATIIPPTSGDGVSRVELTVIPLPTPDTSEEEYLLANLNRWRGQVQLPPIGAEELVEQLERVEFADGEAVMFDLTGTGGGGPSRAGVAPPRPQTPEDSSPRVGPRATDIPDGWTPSSGSSLSVFAYAVGEGEDRAETTLTRLAAAAGAAGPNINRWRGQIGLPPLSDEEIAAALRPLSVGGAEAAYIRLDGDRQTILGAILVRDDSSWFVKFTGSRRTADREQSNFEAFCRGLKFE